MLKQPGYVNLAEWNQQVMQLGLGDTSTYSPDERRMKQESGQYNLYVYNGTEEILVNNVFTDFKKPGFETRKFAVSSSGTTLFFIEAFEDIPIPVATCAEGPKFVHIQNITTTSLKVYLYNSSGTLTSGFVTIHVVGERNAI